jgi:hypothetical protein
MSGYNFFEILDKVQEKLKEIAEDHKASFIRLATLLSHTTENSIALQNQKLRSAPLHAHAEETNILNLLPNEDDLMRNLRKTTRYMITRAMKEGVTVTRSKDESDITDLITMHHTHSHRTNGKLQYGAFSEHFIRNLLNYFGDDCQIFRGEYG